MTTTTPYGKLAFGSTNELRADFNGNGVVDAADYTVWRDSLGKILSASAVVAPAIIDVPDSQQSTKDTPIANSAAPAADAASQFMVRLAVPLLIAPPSQAVLAKHSILPAPNFSVAAREDDLLLPCFKSPILSSPSQAAPPASTSSVDDQPIVDSDDMIYAAIDRAFDLWQPLYSFGHFAIATH